MFQNLLPLLVVLVLPILLMLMWELFKDFNTKDDITKSTNAAQQLDELISGIPGLCLDLNVERTVHEITHTKSENTFFFDGSREEIITELWKKTLPNNFIKYSNNQWINAHWIEKIGSNSLELHNGAEISQL